jgi:hypothetical protein
MEPDKIKSHFEIKLKLTFSKLQFRDWKVKRSKKKDRLNGNLFSELALREKTWKFNLDRVSNLMFSYFSVYFLEIESRKLCKNKN